jgi:hypothetical protein
MIVTIPFASISMNFLSKYQKEVLKMKDERMGIISEMLTGIRIIKVRILFKLLIDCIQLHNI